MRMTCSASATPADFPTRLTAVKYPANTEPRDKKGRLTASSRRERMVSGSPMIRLPIKPAAAVSPTQTAAPKVPA